MIEIYNYLNGTYPDIMNTIFTLRQNTCNFRNLKTCQNVKTSLV